MGSLVISLDAELSWGLHDRYPLSANGVERVDAARGAWMRLVSLFEEYSIPATWAIVGHLLVEDGVEFRERHPLGNEWFSRAQRRLADEPDCWLGVDLVNSVRSSPVAHELGSHSFSHVVFGEATAAVADAEYRLAQEASERLGLTPRSFVFPRNEVAHRRALLDNGFVCYRGQRPWRLPALPGVRGGTMLAGALTGLAAPPVVTPFVTGHGLVNVPASMFLGGLRDDPWLSLAELGVDRSYGWQNSESTARASSQVCFMSGSIRTT